MTSPARQYFAVVICFVVGFAIAVVVTAVLRLVHPSAELVRRGRLPGQWQRFTAWARSRSLRLWCPAETTATIVAAHLRAPGGRRLCRLGVSLVDEPGLADVVVVDRWTSVDLEVERARVPAPCAAIMLDDAGDAVAFEDAIVELSVALRWPEQSVAS